MFSGFAASLPARAGLYDGLVEFELMSGSKTRGMIREHMGRPRMSRLVIFFVSIYNARSRVAVLVPERNHRIAQTIVIDNVPNVLAIFCKGRLTALHASTSALIPTRERTLPPPSERPLYPECVAKLFSPRKEQH
jgi:hypothetical protein